MRDRFREVWHFRRSIKITIVRLIDLIQLLTDLNDEFLISIILDVHRMT